MTFTTLQSKWALLGFLAAIGAVPAEGFAQQAQRNQVSAQIHETVEAMKTFTAIPYGIDPQRGQLTGRSESNEREWNDLAIQLSSEVRRASPADIDDQAFNEIMDQVLDPYAWDHRQLELALAHIGSRAINKLIEMIKSSSDSLYRHNLSETLGVVVGNTANKDIDDATIENIASLLANSDRVVRLFGGVLSLAEVGPRARGALPALERELERAREEEREQLRSLGGYLGPRAVDYIGSAISVIKGEPVRIPY